MIDSLNLAEWLVFEDNLAKVDPKKLQQFHLCFPQYTKYLNKNILNIKNDANFIIQKYPFVNQLNDQILFDISQRNELIKQIVKISIKQRSSSEIRFPDESYDNKKIATYAKTLIKNLNNFIYKNKINKFWTDVVLINNNKITPYISNIEIICTNGKEYFILLLKFSKSPYIDKYKYESELINNTISELFNIKIKETILLNIMSEQAICKI
ncbi:hypothetical protein EELLY_v1c04370 [Entomoplasma ellychniae]|uniref:Uncharacterized protein n=1 Tax=Entomoplasma ellychniae TaxID=2114 RepID=A0A8E2UCU8_9MOLU|nr:hypothetical protein [Entomoplasma ellychniae]PPE04757.1 hypothetical protein EELLY_v1c04370 [Entomoplasma ellychniae]